MSTINIKENTELWNNNFNHRSGIPFIISFNINTGNHILIPPNLRFKMWL